MLDLPELFAPARSVRGRISIVCPSTIDLKPETESDVIARGVVDSPEAPFDFDMLRQPFPAVERGIPRDIRLDRESGFSGVFRAGRLTTGLLQARSRAF